MEGKADWMASGLPVEGEAGPFTGEAVRDVPTCSPEDTVSIARQMLDASDAGPVAVVHEGYLVGAVEAAALDGAEPGQALLGLMQPVPETVRPSVPLSEVAESGIDSLFVTTPEGRLLGELRPDAL